VQPNTKKELWPKRTRVWAYSREVYEQHERDGLIYWGQDGHSETPSFKRYRHLLRRGEGIVPNTWWTHDAVGHTDEAKKEIRALDIGDGAFDFVTPKPTRLIEMVMRVGAAKESLVLDAFAGSGTTGHAVLSLNNADGGKRRFILVEMDEAICRDVTAQRIRKAIVGYGDTPGLGGGFRFCGLGAPLFDENGGIGGDVRFADLAAHVFFTETGVPLPRRPRKLAESDPPPVGEGILAAAGRPRRQGGVSAVQWRAGRQAPGGRQRADARGGGESAAPPGRPGAARGLRRGVPLRAGGGMDHPGDG
jgi:adenine-specific DNA-methyltransferase